MAATHLSDSCERIANWLLSIPPNCFDSRNESTSDPAAPRQRRLSLPLLALFAASSLAGSANAAGSRTFTATALTPESAIRLSKAEIRRPDETEGPESGSATLAPEAAPQAAEALGFCDVTVAPGISPAGYIPLSAFGVPPIAGMGDDIVFDFVVPRFTFGGESYARLGFSSNGYAIVGGSHFPADNTYFNQNFPNLSRPNNVLAPFWTDLNPAVAGELRIAVLTDGTNDWIVMDWANVREFSTANSNSFEIWIGIEGDASPAQDVTFAYGPIGGSGDNGFLTVGAENRLGSRGQDTYLNGVGTLPSNGTELRVSSTGCAIVSCDVTIDAGATPAGYLPLSLFGVLPVAGVLDDNVINFSVPPFAFGAETYSTLGFSSNGYAIVGGSIGPIDNTYFNQNLPDVSRPNGTLAPFWTDLNPAAAGELRIATLTDGADTWIVLDWANVREYSTPNSNSFEIWIGILADANPGEDISYAYGPIGGSGNGGFLTVGAENRFGTRGQNAYFDGFGALPENGTQLRVRMVSCKLIFSSGFEPGNVLAWSASAP